MPIDPDVQKALDGILSKIEDLRRSTKTGEFVIPLGPFGLTDDQATEVKKAAETAARVKLQQFGVALPAVAGTWSYSR